MKSFKGLIADNSVQTIPLSTNNGSTGYRITKFRLMPNDPGSANTEHIVKIYSIPQGTTATTQIDFSDNTLLAAGHVNNDLQTSYYPIDAEIVFDNMTFNQDIYVTHRSEGTVKPCNYYIELEQVKLALDENTVATLKDIRNIKSNE